MLNQRWRARRHFYRPSGETINIREYEIAVLAGDQEAKSFIEEHHYSRSYPAARWRFGLFHRGAMVGTAVFSHPCNDSVLTNVFQCPARMAVELGRFVLLDEVPGNGESFFLGRCFELLRREELIGVVSFSDPMPRQTIDGHLVHRGHVGTIYQAFNGSYLGRSTPRTIRLLPDGSLFSERSIQKIRQNERGSNYAAQILQSFGAPPLEEDPVGWLTQWLPRLTRAVRHPGNHKYCWALTKTARKQIPASLPYPKFSSLFTAVSGR